jgi:hypothetical protein
VQKVSELPFFNEDMSYKPLNYLITRNKTGVSNRCRIYTALFPRKNLVQALSLFDFRPRSIGKFVTQKECNRIPGVCIEKQALLQRKCGIFQFVTSMKGTQDSGVLLAMHDSALAELEFKSSLKTRKASFTFDSIIDDLDRFYVARKLQLVSEQINAQNVIAGNSKIRMLEEVKSIAEDPELATIPSIELYQTVFLTLTESGNEIHFEKLKQILVEKGELISIKEQKEAVQYLKISVSQNL